jgi:hypothetical protein
VGRTDQGVPACFAGVSADYQSHTAPNIPDINAADDKKPVLSGFTRFEDIEPAVLVHRDFGYLAIIQTG